jgi:hypothetical protein
MTSLFDEADYAADAMRKRLGFSEADLAPMFSALSRRSVTPGYKDEEIRDLFDPWFDHYTARRGVERQALIERMPELLRQRDALVEQMPDMTAPGQVAARLRIQAIANEIAESYARIQDRPPPSADDAGLTGDNS